MRRCARCSATMSRRRARWSRPTGCASTSPTEADVAGGAGRGRGHRQPRRAAERPVDTRLMGARRRERDRAPARCSARNTATRSASSPWAMARRRRAGRALFGRALRRHACAPHRRYRPHDRVGKRGRVGRAPHRGEDASAARHHLNARRFASGSSLFCSRRRRTRRRARPSPLLEDRRKLEREFSEARRRLAMAAARPKRRSKRDQGRQVLPQGSRRRRDEGSEVAGRRGEAIAVRHDIEEMGAPIVIAQGRLRPPVHLRWNLEGSSTAYR